MSFFSEYRQANSILKDRHPVIFYAESRYYYPYFKQLLEDVLSTSDLTVLYITSDADDPLLSKQSPRLRVVYIKTFLLYVFPRLKCGVMVMTMPDLGYYGYKRSPQVGCYAYVFHAAVSVHQQYSEKAFFNYDAMLAVHTNHIEELNNLQSRYNLPAKNIIEYGYPLLDDIEKQYTGYTSVGARRKILVAPSWFDQCIFETCIEELVRYLSELPYDIIIRSHPEYIRRRRSRYEVLKTKCARYSNIRFDHNAALSESLVEADLLITDRSGIAFEYAFGTYRPVLFIDTPLKVMNPAWEKTGLEPVENILRKQMGVSIDPKNLSSLPAAVIELENNADELRRQLKQMRSQLFFNSYQQGADYIISKAR